MTAVTSSMCYTPLRDQCQLCYKVDRSLDQADFAGRLAVDLTGGLVGRLSSRVRNAVSAALDLPSDQVRLLGRNSSHNQ